MALYIKDPEVNQLATQLAEARKTTKTEVIRQVLLNELARDEKDTYVERAVAFARDMRAKGNPDLIKTVDKAFIDSLYED
ncbi:type II toxin-antitoxin system VapB family antitoxin [Rhizobium sp.]